MPSTSEAQRRKMWQLYSEGKITLKQAKEFNTVVHDRVKKRHTKKKVLRGK